VREQRKTNEKNSKNPIELLDTGLRAYLAMKLHQVIAMIHQSFLF